MTFVLAGYLTLAAVVAHVCASSGRMMTTSAPTRETHRIAKFVLFISLLFFSPFYLLGALELFWGWPTISPVSLLVTETCLATASLVVLWRSGQLTPELLREISSWRRPTKEEQSHWTRLSQVTCAATLAVFVLLGISLVFGFPRGWEVRAYHLPIAVNIFQTGSLQTWDQQFMNTFPANMSIFAGYFLQLLPERLVSALNLPFLAMACFAAFALARLAGGDAASSRLTAAGLATIPIIAFSSLEVGSDIAGIAFLGIAFLFCLGSPASSSFWPLTSGLAAGLAFGFKSLHLVGSAFLGAVVLARSWRISSGVVNSERFRRSLGQGMLFALGFGLTAGIWLIRNYVEFGNPLYPVHLGAVFDLFGWSKAPDVDYTARTLTQSEWVESSWKWIVYPWVEGQRLGQNFKHSSGLGAFFAAMVPVALVNGVLQMCRRSRSTPGHRVDSQSAFALTTLVTGTLFITAMWWVMVDRQPRYLMGALILAVPLVALLLSSLTFRARKILEIVTITCIGVMLFVISSKQLVDFGNRYMVHRQSSRSDFYRYPKEVDELPSGSTVLAMTRRPMYYPLAGENKSNKVIGSFPAHSAMKVAGREHLTSEILDSLGVSHLYVTGDPQVRIGPCVRLEELARLDGGPYGSSFRILYEVKPPEAACSLESHPPPD